MTQIRETFLGCAHAAHELLARPELAARWEDVSALESFSLKGLAGHLFRGTGSVIAYLDRDEPTGEPISAARYYAEAVRDEAQTGTSVMLDSKLHRAIRQRGEEAASGGHSALIEASAAGLAELTARLPLAPDGRKVRVFKDLVLRLDDYLITRIIELAVHIDDLALSLDLAPPKLPANAHSIAIETLVEVARLRHGDAAVLTALTRRERDDVEALRVL